MKAAIKRCNATNRQITYVVELRRGEDTVRGSRVKWVGVMLMLLGFWVDGYDTSLYSREGCIFVSMVDGRWMVDVHGRGAGNEIPVIIMYPECINSSVILSMKGIVRLAPFLHTHLSIQPSALRDHNIYHLVCSGHSQWLLSSSTVHVQHLKPQEGQDASGLFFSPS